MSVNIVDRGYISVLVFQQAFSFSRQYAKIKVCLMHVRVLDGKANYFPSVTWSLVLSPMISHFRKTPWFYSYTTHS